MNRGASTHEVSDADLMRGVQADDEAAFGELHDRFAGRAHSVAKAIVLDRVRAEDAAQEAFLSVWRGRAAYDPGQGSVAGWLLGIVRNRAIDALRANGRHDRRRADEGHAEEQGSGSRDLEHRVVERSEAATLRASLARLPEAQRDVIALAFFGELTSSEIAAQLALPLGTVKGRMRLGLTKLRHDRDEPPG